jgi:hypothetical protein
MIIDCAAYALTLRIAFSFAIMLLAALYVPLRRQQMGQGNRMNIPSRLTRSGTLVMAAHGGTWRIRIRSRTKLKESLQSKIALRK